MTSARDRLRTGPASTVTPGMTRKDFLKTAGAGLAGLVAVDALGAVVGPPPPGTSGAKPLRTRVLGRSGIRTTALGFGAARTMEPSLVQAALDRGITFFDTGRSYFNGNNERMLGSALAGVRKDVILQSKMKIEPQGDSVEVWSSLRKTLEANLASSLKALRTDYLDVFLFHDVTDVRVLTHDVVTEFFAAARAAGRIRAHGFSCHGEPELLRAANASKFYDVIMTPYNHAGAYVHSVSGSRLSWDRPSVEKELAAAHAGGLGVAVMKTCSGGPYAPPGESGPPSMAAAIKWAIDRPFVGVAIVAMANLEEMEEDFPAGF
jgi:aryl-alcohol dehydrogenase-like predicted oxidoreductase